MVNFKSVDENGEKGICGECGTDQPLNYMEKQLKKGWDNFPCKWCGGGPVVIVRQEHAENAVRQMNRERGMYSKDD